MHFTINKGIHLPVDGQPESTIHPGHKVANVALLGDEYIGLKPTMMVSEGERVKRGQPLFTDKKNPGVLFTAPGAGVIEAINRGARRVLRSVVITLDPAGSEEDEIFNKYSRDELGSLNAQQVCENLINSGCWTAFRTRPYSKIPKIGSTPHAIFVTAMDSNPLAPDPAIIISERKEEFNDGLAVISKLTGGNIYVCKEKGASIYVNEASQIQVVEFSGPHPAGLAGTHIHFIDPVNASRTVWTIGYQDVIAFGKLFTTGKLWIERIVSLAGPIVPKPRLVRTRLGANIEEMVENELIHVECRVISGSVFSGHHAHDWAGFLGRYHNQITVLAEGRNREFLGWIMPGREKFSATNAFLSSVLKPDQFKITTSQNGSPRAMVPIGSYEQVMPLRMLPTQLLRSLLVRDTDTAQALGCLELDEEDLALCSFVCPGKYDFGPVLRANLEQIEKEG
ncbi:MAG: Na(+)-translocating NADH-quinone reductase subunit A [Gammaproteobacteria bacterium]|nr:Na(+)-translocating NADH-quinone reductase subunit A [Gammaproteobacteria bacterium]